MLLLLLLCVCPQEGSTIRRSSGPTTRRTKTCTTQIVLLCKTCKPSHSGHMYIPHKFARIFGSLIPPLLQLCRQRRAHAAGSSSHYCCFCCCCTGVQHFCLKTNICYTCGELHTAAVSSLFEYENGKLQNSRTYTWCLRSPCCSPAKTRPFHVLVSFHFNHREPGPVQPVSYRRPKKK